MSPVSHLKNAENDYFGQRLECAVPKRWSKYTTSNVTSFIPILKFTFLKLDLALRLRPNGNQKPSSYYCKSLQLI